VGEFDFKTKTVLLNNGDQMPILGLGTYALDHDTCVNSVKTLLANGGRLIDTAYMYGNEEAVGEGIRQGMAEYGIRREDIFVITKIYPNQFDDQGCCKVLESECIQARRSADIDKLYISTD
jgi:diketogulonate reductase-like aldo/keto reductase